MYFFVLDKVEDVTPFAALVSFIEVIWEQRIKILTNQNVVLESAQLKRVGPVNRLSSMVTVGSPSPGFHPAAENPISARPFGYALASRFVTGRKNSYSIKFPFLVESLLNIHTLKNPVTKISYSVELREFLSNELSFSVKNTADVSKILKFKLALRSTKKDAIAEYLPVDFVSILGFFDNSSSSILKAPINQDDLVVTGQNAKALMQVQKNAIFDIGPTNLIGVETTLTSRNSTEEDKSSEGVPTQTNPRTISQEPMPTGRQGGTISTPRSSREQTAPDVSIPPETSTPGAPNPGQVPPSIT